MPLESRIQEAPVAHLAGFLVTAELRQLLTRFTVFASDERPADRRIKLHGDIFYHCDNIEAPALGDIRVQFSYAGKSGDTVSGDREGLLNASDEGRSGGGRENLTWSEVGV